jgi:hypothetical protein
MDKDATRRNSWIACPKCGHKVARVRMCDMDVKCKHCGHEYEVIISPCNHCKFSLEEKNPTSEYTTKEKPISSSNK